MIRVEDQGIGISHQDCERVFDRFEQGGAVSGNKGLGLGLWITDKPNAALCLEQLWNSLIKRLLLVMLRVSA